MKQNDKQIRNLKVNKRKELINWDNMKTEQANDVIFYKTSIFDLSKVSYVITPTPGITRFKLTALLGKFL